MASDRARSHALVLGLTGPIACGKTSVGDMLLALGAIERIDADQVVHELLTADTETTRAVVERFGTAVLTDRGDVDRPALAAIVFSDAAALHDLESITHPAVQREIRDSLGKLSRSGVVVVDAVKLLESELRWLCDQIWVVRCDVSVQWRRLTEARGMEPAQARGRIAAQPNFAGPGVDLVIENSGSREELWRQVETAWHGLGRSSA